MGYTIWARSGRTWNWFPVYIDNLNRVLPRGEFLPVPLLSCITIGPPMWLEQGEPKTIFCSGRSEAVRRLKDL